MGAYCWGWTGAAVRVLDVCACALCELFEQESAFYPQLFNLALDAGEAKSGGVVGFFDLICAILELDAFSSIGFLNGRR